jgi:hypothetical protein
MFRPGTRGVRSAAATFWLILGLALTAVIHLASVTWPETDERLDGVAKVTSSDPDPSPVVGDKTRKSSSEGFDTSKRFAAFGRCDLLRVAGQSYPLSRGGDDRTPLALVGSATATRAPPRVL